MERFRNVAAVFGITTVIALAAATRHHFQMMEGDRPPSYLTWPHAMIQEMPYYYLWALTIPLVLWFVRRMVRLGLPPGAALAGHVGFAAAVILTQAVLHAVVNGVSLADALMRLPTEMVTYGAILGTVLAYDYYRRLVARELAGATRATELAAARLRTLQAQLHPHFVFNALNSVAMLVRGQRNAEAVDTIANLSDLLRDALDDDERAVVRLDEELGFVDRYLKIEAVRFGDRLQVTVDVPVELRDARVPRLLLQPLVENAVRHGLGRRAAAGRLAIGAARDGDRLVIRVEDDGPGPGDGAATRGNGVGLSNTRQRLATFYGADADLTLAQAPGGGAVATVTLPWSHSPAA